MQYHRHIWCHWWNMPCVDPEELNQARLQTWVGKYVCSTKSHDGNMQVIGEVLWQPQVLDDVIHIRPGIISMVLTVDLSSVGWLMRIQIIQELSKIPKIYIYLKVFIILNQWHNVGSDRRRRKGLFSAFSQKWAGIDQSVTTGVTASVKAGHQNDERWPWLFWFEHTTRFGASARREKKNKAAGGGTRVWVLSNHKSSLSCSVAVGKCIACLSHA